MRRSWPTLLVVLGPLLCWAALGVCALWRLNEGQKLDDPLLQALVRHTERPDFTNLLSLDFAGVLDVTGIYSQRYGDPWDRQLPILKQAKEQFADDPRYWELISLLSRWSATEDDLAILSQAELKEAASSALLYESYMKQFRQWESYAGVEFNERHKTPGKNYVQPSTWADRLEIRASIDREHRQEYDGYISELKAALPGQAEPLYLEAIASAERNRLSEALGLLKQANAMPMQQPVSFPLRELDPAFSDKEVWAPTLQGWANQDLTWQSIGLDDEMVVALTKTCLERGDPAGLNTISQTICRLYSTPMRNARTSKRGVRLMRAMANEVAVSARGGNATAQAELSQAFLKIEQEADVITREVNALSSLPDSREARWMSFLTAGQLLDVNSYDSAAHQASLQRKLLKKKLLPLWEALAKFDWATAMKWPPPSPHPAG